MKLRREQQIKLCQIILDLCIQPQMYEEFFALLGQHLCFSKRKYVEYFEKLFQDQYETVHRLEHVRLRTVAKFFAQLLISYAISWRALGCIHLNQEDKTSPSCI